MPKKILCALLAAAMLVGTLVSCGKTDEQPTDTSAESNTGAVTEEETRESLDIPDTRYNDAELVFLTRDENEWSTVEIFTEELTNKTDNISQAVYERNDTIFQKYGVTIKELKQQTGLHNGAVSKEVSAPTGDFQAIITNTAGSASFATQGWLWNLNSDDIEYMNFTKSWWDTNMAEGMSINDRLYFATGDLLTSDNDATFVILFNKQLVTDCQIPDLYAMVENGEWTMDTFYEFEQLSVQDKDGDGKLTYNTDVCGFAYTGDAPYCFLFGGGITLVTKDENDYPVYNLNVERAQNIVDKGNLIFSKDYTIDMNSFTDSGNTIMAVGQTTFGEGHALFFSEVMQSVTRMRGFDVDFGILPFPKYDKQQADYCSMMHLTASCVSIPKSVTGDQLVMVDSMIEAMAYYAVDTLTKQYYEINLKTRDSKDEKSGPMMDKILANRICDLSYYYQWGGNAFGTLANTLLPGSSKGVASQNQRYQRSIENSIKQLIKNMEKFDN